jgi:DNA-binding winged helix-turn-helix (wHTH) protein
MTTKYLSALEDDISLVGVSAFPMIPDLEGESLLASIESSSLEFSPTLDRISIGAYRIGLIPIESLSKSTGCSNSVLTRLGSVLVLPFTWSELLARVRGGSSSPQSDIQKNVVRFGIATADFKRMEAFRSGQPVALTPMQFNVLRYFVLNPDRVISRDELLEKVWGYNHYPTTRTVDNALLRLRRALEPVPAEPVHFRTVHGAGYKFVP